MKRRELFAIVGSTALAAVPVGAQTPAIARIGVLVQNDSLYHPEPFQQAMQRRGWPPSAYRLEIRSGKGRLDRLDELARELVAAKVDVIVALQTPAAMAAKRATTTIPIVMQAGDPVGNGIVASTTRPGGNVTGVDAATAVLNGKRIELLKEVVPSLRRVAVFVNPPDPFSKSMVEQMQAAGTAANVSVAVIPAAADLDSAMRDVQAGGSEAVVVQPSLPLRPIAGRLLAARLPGISGDRDFVEAGGLLTIASSLRDRYDLIALCLDKILKGTPPRDIPIMQPSEFEIVANRSTARRLGLTLSPLLLARADEIIE